MPNLGPTELLIIAGVVVMLFGAAKLPKLARSMGESARIFKAETKGLRDDEQTEDSASDKDNSQVRHLPGANQQEPQEAETTEQQYTEHKKAS